MFEFEITWESGKTTVLRGSTLKSAVSLEGYDECVLEKMVSYVKKPLKADPNVCELLNGQNNYIRGVSVDIFSSH